MRIRNTGTQTFRGKIAPDQYVYIPAPPDVRSETMVTWEMACQFLGKPDITDSRLRTERLDQLRAFYGVYDNREAWDHANAGILFDEKHDPFHKHPLPVLPRLEVYDITTNERIFMLLDDPDGTAGLTAEILPPQDQAIALLQGRLAEQERQMQAMLAELTRLTAANTTMTPPAPSVAPAPNPTQAANAPIGQAPVVTGQPQQPPAPSLQGDAPLLIDGSPVEPGYQPDGSLVLANGTVIPAPNSPDTQASRYKTPVADAPGPMTDTEKRAAGIRTQGPEWTLPTAESLATATEDTPRTARI